MRNTLVIAGAGFCGTVLAANLLRRPPPDATDIVLIERGSAMGRGVAYAVREFPYLLNVPAARLSADSRDPMQFLRFARRHLPDADGEDFLPRPLYGDYLQDMPLGGDGRDGAARSCGAARGASRGAPCVSGTHARASRSSPFSRRFNSSRVLYMEMPVRSSPPRSTRPSTCAGRAA